MKKFLICFAIISIFLCAACTMNEPVLPQKIEKASLIFVAPQQGDYAMEGIPAAEIFMQRIEKSSASLPYELDCLLIDESIGADKIASAIQAYMADNQVLGICGFWEAENAAKTAQLCLEEQIPLLLWAVVREDLTTEESYPFVLRLSPTARTENRLLVQEIMAKKNFQNWAVITDSSKYGLANQESILKALQEMGGNAAYTLCIDEAESDFAACAVELGKNAADIIYFGGSPEHLGDFLTALSSAKVQTPVAAVGAASLGLEVLPEEVFTVNYDFAQYNDFYTQFYLYQNFDCEMGIMTPLAYEAAGIMLAGLQACGETPNGMLLASALASIEYHGMNGEITFDAYGDGTNTSLLEIVYLQDAHWQILE